MKIIILDTVYNEFLWDFERKNRPGKKNSEFCQDLLFAQRFGTSDAYSHYLNKLGCDAKEVVCNIPKNFFEINSVDLSIFPLIPENLNRSAFIARQHFRRFRGLFQADVLARIVDAQPDVVYCQDINFFSVRTLSKIKQLCTLLVGQIASPLPSTKKLSHFDLVLSSLPNLVEKLQSFGIKSQYFKLAFDPRLINEIGQLERNADVSFVGGLGRHHRNWIEFFENLNSACNINMYGYGASNISKNSKLRREHKGPVWGRDMYRVLASSKITINRHISLSENYANNMRLYEATGMGSMLLTDEKINLKDIFDVNQEIVTYSSLDDAADKIKYFLNNPTEACEIASAGQRRVLASHSYEVRMKELYGILVKHLNYNGR